MMVILCRCFESSDVGGDPCFCNSSATRLAYRTNHVGDVLGPCVIKSKPEFAKTYTHNVFTTFLQNVYENCAGYNLRHCQFRRFKSNKSYLINILKDLTILCCFIVANLVVFMTIFTRLAVQVSFCLMESYKWIRRITQNKDTRPQLLDVNKISVSNLYKRLERL